MHSWPDAKFGSHSRMLLSSSCHTYRGGSLSRVSIDLQSVALHICRDVASLRSRARAGGEAVLTRHQAQKEAVGDTVLRSIHLVLGQGLYSSFEALSSRPELILFSSQQPLPSLYSSHCHSHGPSYSHSFHLYPSYRVQPAAAHSSSSSA